MNERSSWWPVVLVTGVAIVSQSAFVGDRFVILMYAIELKASTAMLGVITGLPSLAGAVTSALVGRWIDRRGSKPAILMAIATLIAGPLIPLASNDLISLCVSISLVGAGFNISIVASQQFISAVSAPEERTRNFSIAATGASISTFAGPLIAGFGIDWLGFDPTLALLAVLPLIPLTVILAGVVRFPPPAARKSKATGGAKQALLDYLRQRELRVIVILVTLAAFSYDLFMFLFPVYGASVGLSASTIGTTMALYSLTTIGVRAALPAVAGWLGPTRLVLVAVVWNAVMFATFPFFTAAPMLMVLACLLGLCMGMSAPLSMVLISERVPADRQGEAIGLRATLINVCHSVFPLMFGALGTATGLPLVFWMVSAILLTGAAVCRPALRAPPPGAAGR